MIKKALALLLAALLALPAGAALAKEQQQTQRILLDNDILGFVGDWGHMHNLDNLGIMGYYNNSASSTTADNTAFDCTANGCTRFYWYANYNTYAYVKADIYIDNEFVQQLDCSSIGTATTPALVWQSPELPCGKHTLRVVRSDVASNKGKYFEVDRIEVDTAGGGIVLNDTAATFINYAGGFELEENTSASSGTLHTAKNEGSCVLISFAGDSFTLYGQKNSRGGKASLYLDGELLKSLDYYAESEQNDAVICNVSGLGDGYHLVKLLANDNGEVNVDAIEVEKAYNAATEIYRLGKEALEQMKNGTKSYIDPESWHAVSTKAQMPVDGVTLDGGIYADAFNKNVKMIKKSLSLKDYVYISSVWINNFPSSNEGRVLAGAANSLRWIKDETLDAGVKKLLQVAKERTKESGYCLPEPEEWYNGLFLTSDDPYTSVDECKNYGRVMYTQGLYAAILAGYDDAAELMRGLYNWLNSCDYKEYLLPGSLGIQGILGATLCYNSGVGTPDDIITNMLYYEMDWYLEYMGNAMPECMYAYPLDRPHSYMATAANAFLDMYGVTGEEKYLQAALGAYTIFKEYYITAGGGVCMCEGRQFTPCNYTLSHSPRGVYETCNNVLWADLNYKLMQYFPGEERFAKYLEQSLTNIVLASQDAQGQIRYFNNMTEQKETASIVNTCCEVQATRQLAQLPQFIYTLGNDGVYINMFASSTISFSLANATGKLTTVTAFPYGDDISITADLQQGESVNVYCRIPGWIYNPTEIKLNGKKICDAVAGTYVTVSLKHGDKLEYTLPMQLKASKYTGESEISGKVRYGIEYGPVMMSLCGHTDDTLRQPGGEEISCLDIAIEDYIGTLELKNDATLLFRSDLASGVYLKPYYAVLGSEHFTNFPVFKSGNSNVIYKTAQPVTEPETTPEPTPTVTAASSPAPTASTKPVPDGGNTLGLIIGCVCAAVVICGIIAAVVIVKNKKK